MAVVFGIVATMVPSGASAASIRLLHAAEHVVCGRGSLRRDPSFQQARGTLRDALTCGPAAVPDSTVLAALARVDGAVWATSLADGLDTLFDGISNIVGIIAVRISRRPPDAEHPYGHRKFETIAALFIAAALFVTTWELATGAIDRLLNPRPVIVNTWSVGALVFGALLPVATG